MSITHSLLSLIILQLFWKQSCFLSVSISCKDDDNVCDEGDDGIVYLLLGVHVEHAPGPGGPVPEVGEEVSKLGPVQDHGGGEETVVSQDWLHQSQTNTAATQHTLHLQLQIIREYSFNRVKYNKILWKIYIPTLTFK